MEDQRFGFYVAVTMKQKLVLQNVSELVRKEKPSAFPSLAFYDSYLERNQNGRKYNSNPPFSLLGLNYLSYCGSPDSVQGKLQWKQREEHGLSMGLLAQ